MLSILFKTGGYIAYYTLYWTSRIILNMLTEDPSTILLLPEYL